jgi:hypothetical protein
VSISPHPGNPLNEVELMSDSFMNNNGVLRGNNVIKLIPDQSAGASARRRVERAAGRVQHPLPPPTQSDRAADISER